MYSLPSHLSQSARELILRMLVVDPIKRITIAEVRQHPWYQHKLPAYLTMPPAMIETHERYIDEEIVVKVDSIYIYIYNLCKVHYYIENICLFGNLTNLYYDLHVLSICIY